MAKPSDHPGFKQLLSEWNRRLAESGFHDVEAIRHGDRVLKQSGSARRYERLDPITREAKFQFYCQVAKCVSETKFKTEFERQVLTLYAQGHSQAAIKRMLAIPGHRCKVYYPVYRWLKVWGLK